MKIDVVLLTGDTQPAAQAVAHYLGIRHFHAELLPDQKTAFIADQVRQGQVVAMLGDGINDAPALSEATVGVAMGAGTDVARESADVVLIGNDLMKFVETVRVARNCRGIYSAELLRHSHSRYHRHRSGCGRIPQPVSRGLHSRCLGADLHSQFDAPAPAPKRTPRIPGHRHAGCRIVNMTSRVPI
jgi:hypothetical protein